MAAMHNYANDCSMTGWKHDDRTGRFESQFATEVQPMTASETLKKILSNGAVWGALILLLNLIVTTYFTVPQNILAAANMLAIAVLGAVGVYGVGAQAGYVRGLDDAQNK